jgi:TonB family protein
MFCPTCGGPNPEGSRFCNQCGATLSALGAAASTGQGGGVTRAPTDQGLSTGDRIELPLTGPSKRTVVAMLLGVGFGCLGLGALAAWKTLGQSSGLPPVTPVGLFGEPSTVTNAEPDGGVTAAPTGPTAPSPTGRVARPTGPAPARPTTVASNERPTPTGPAAPAPTTPSGNTPSGNADPTPSGNTPSGSADPTPAAPSGTTPPGSADPTPAAPATPGGNTPSGNTDPTPALPAEPGGVRERVPGTSAGSGYRLGDETDATGHMDPAAFRFVYNHYQSQIASCYSNASRYDTVSGVIVMRVRIGENGHVRSTRIISDSAHNTGLTRCVQNSVQSWRYPQPEGGEVEVDYPMRFGSGR